MKGLQIAESFWRGWGKPYLEAHHPTLLPRVAAGRLQGSDVLGGDDEISRDHGWGPQFWLFLTEEDFVAHGENLAKELNAAAPNPWEGVKLAGGGDKSVHVESVTRWMKGALNLDALPATPHEWLRKNEWGISIESPLYFIRHGAVWHDGAGELTRWRTGLHRYPEPVQVKRLSEECFNVWHYGEYNFVQRMAKRRDPLAIAVCLGEFTSALMKLTLLLDGDFVPYWKWLPYEFRKRDSAQEYIPLLEELLGSRDIDRQVTLVKDICARVHRRLHDKGMVDGKNANKWLLPLLNDHLELKAKAKEAGL